MRLTAALILTFLCLAVVLAAGPASAIPPSGLPAVSGGDPGAPAGLPAALGKEPAADPTPSPSASSPVSAELVAFPAWFGPTTTITATIAVTNNTSKPISGISIHLEMFDVAHNRSTLGAQFGGAHLASLWADSEPFPDTIAPGDTANLQFNLGKSPPEYGGFAKKVSDGAFPVRFTVDVNDDPETAFMSEIVYFQESQVATPLDVSLVIPLDTPTVLNPKGQEISRALETAIAPGGRIASILSALEQNTSGGLKVGLAPTGKLLSSLWTLAHGFTRKTKSSLQQVAPTDPVAQNAGAMLQAIQSLVARGTVRLIATPYSLAPLPGLMDNGLATEVNQQVEDDAATVRTFLGPNVDTLQGWLLPADGIANDATVGQVAGLGVTNLILAPASLEQPSSPPALDPSAQVTAVAVKSQSSVGALVEDAGLTDLLSPSSSADLSPSQVLQQFLAYSATIQEERPGVARTVCVVTPPDWNPDPVVLTGLLASLTPVTGAPWMVGITPDAATTAGTLPGRVMVQKVPDDGLATPPKEYFSALRTARQRLDEFKSLSPPPDLVNQLTKQLLIAEGGEWWAKGSGAAGGEAFARAAINQVNGQLSKIRVGDQTYTLTSKGAEIPLTVDSGLDYQVKVVLYLASDKLTFEQGGPCPGVPSSQATCLTVTLSPKLQTIRVRALSTFTGRVPVQIEVRTPTNATISQGLLHVRSTAYNIVALGIVGAAALFLLVTWTWGFVRRRVAAGRLSQVLGEPPPAPAGHQERA